MFLRFPVMPEGPIRYPSGRIQKGPVLAWESKDLSEEGVGFGVPVLKAGQVTVYPGSAVWKSLGKTAFQAEYDLNIREHFLIKGRRIRSKPLYRLNGWLSELHMRSRFLRSFLDPSNLALRRALDIESVFEESGSAGTARAAYAVDPERGTLAVDLDLTNMQAPRGSEIFAMNELGAGYFTRYRDSNGQVLRDDAIGTWGQVRAGSASFADPVHGLEFTLSRLPRIRMYRGRELLPGRLAWAGLAYRLPENVRHFRYTIEIREGTRP